MSKQTDPSRRPTKAERKEQARLDRIELERKIARRKQTGRRVLVVGIVFAVVAGVGIFLLSRNSGTTQATGSATPSVTVELPDANKLPGVMKTAPPWPNNTDQAAARLAALNLPPAGSLLHHHADLLIYINGQPVTVPQNIGLSSDVESPLHTHTDKGTIHIESQDPNFQPVLGQFMDVWGVYFTSECLAGDCASGDTKIRAYMNGQEWTGDPTQIPLTDHEVIVLTFGTADQVPQDLHPPFNEDGTPA